MSSISNPNAPGEAGSVAADPSERRVGPEAVSPAAPSQDRAEVSAAASTGAADASEAAAVAPAGAADAQPALDCADQLRQRWPALFAGPPKPLKLRIQVDIQERAPGVFTRQALSAFFRRHTGSTAYLRALASGKHRYDLDGQPSGEVSIDNRKVASDELARRRNLQNARRELEEQQRRNRATLLHDFERTTLTPANFCALKGIAEPELDGLLAIARQERSAAPRPPERPPEPGRRPHDPRRGPPPAHVGHAGEPGRARSGSSSPGTSPNRPDRPAEAGRGGAPGRPPGAPGHSVSARKEDPGSTPASPPRSAGRRK